MSTTTTTPKTPNAFVRFLDKVGADVVKIVSVVYPAVLTVAEEAEPLVDLVLPAQGALFNACVQAAVLAEQAAVAASKTGVNLTGEQKLAKVIAAVGPLLTSELAKNGVVGTAADAAITNYINAIVALLNGPATSTTATA